MAVSNWSKTTEERDGVRLWQCVCVCVYRLSCRYAICIDLYLAAYVYIVVYNERNNKKIHTHTYLRTRVYHQMQVVHRTRDKEHQAGLEMSRPRTRHTDPTSLCLLLHTTRALTSWRPAPEDEQLVVGRREAVTRSGRRRRATVTVREVRPRVGRGVQHEEVVQITCRSRHSGR